jgi:hypothetical protein
MNARVFLGPVYHDFIHETIRDCETLVQSIHNDFRHFPVCSRDVRVSFVRYFGEDLFQLIV